MTEFGCPQCAMVLPAGAVECPKCGWKMLSMVRDAVFSYLDEQVASGKPTNLISHAEISDAIGLEGRVAGYIILGFKREWNEQQKRMRGAQSLVAPAPVQNPAPQTPMMTSIPDWVLDPYKMQIEQLKEINKQQQDALKDEIKQYREAYTSLVKESRERIGQLETALRDEVRKPNAPNEKWAELDKLAFERLKKDIEGGGTNKATPRSWPEELISGLISSGQLGTIATEAAGLLSDLRNRNNPEHDPYEKFYAEKRARAQYQQPQQRRAVPPANIKRVARRPAPPQAVPNPQSAEEPLIVEAETIPVDESPIESNPAPDTTAENEAIMELFNSQYGPSAAELVPTILQAIDEEQPGMSKKEKIDATVETLRVVAQLRDIGAGVKGLVNKIYTPQTAAQFLITRYSDLAKILAEYGADYWLDRGARLFINHPIHGKDIRFLQEPEAKEAIDKIIVELKKKYRKE